MSPASKEEYGILRECKTKIEHLEKEMKELKDDLKEQRKEKTETKQSISDRKLAIYLAIISIVSSISTVLLGKGLELF